MRFEGFAFFMVLAVVLLSGCTQIASGETGSASGNQPVWKYQCPDGTWVEDMDSCSGSQGSDGSGEQGDGQDFGYGDQGSFGLKDCGEGDISSSGMQEMVADEGLSCLGEELLNECGKAKVSFTTAYGSGTTFESKGMQNGKCVVEMCYGSEEEITEESYKKFADSCAVCPVDLDAILADEQESMPFDENPGVLGFAVMANVSFQLISPDTECAGAMVGIIEEEGI